MTELHELDEFVSGIASRDGVVRVADQDGLDARLAGREVVGCLQGGEQVVVVVEVSGRVGDYDVDIGSRF